MNMQFPPFRNKEIKKNVGVYLFFLAASLLLFAPVLQKNFVSDDFDVLYRVAYHKGFFMKEFFRPLSDITLYLSYLIGGFNPLPFNILNIILHASCCYLLYHFCQSYKNIAVNNRVLFSWFAAILFLIYPFHNETVIWVVGRASLVACFFGFLSLIAAFSRIPGFKKYLISCLLYFLGMCSYETIIPLPAVILVLLCGKDFFLKRNRPVLAAYTLTLLSYMIIRYLVAGVVYGSYGSKIFEPTIQNYVVKALKVAGRLFIPPGNFPLLSMMVFAIMAAGIVLFSILIARKRDAASGANRKLLVLILISGLVPLVFGISTRTYEGDRILYFPSFFLCIWIAFMVDYFFRYKLSILFIILIPVYFIFFFYQSLFVWKKAGEITTLIINSVREIKKDSNRIFLINIPEEYMGAQVLRNGFNEALLINQIDTSGIKVINYFTTKYAQEFPGIIRPAIAGDHILIYPNAQIAGHLLTARIHAEINGEDTLVVTIRNSDKIYYWNKESLVQLKDPFRRK